MELDLEGRTAVVTGSGRGNGRAIAVELAGHGAEVVVNDLDADPAADTVETIENAGGRAISIIADVTDEAEVEAMIESASDRFGAVDIVVNNAGVVDASRFMTKPDDSLFDANFETHVRGSIYTVKHALDGMLDQGYGKVVNITSIHTKNGIGGNPQYDVAKFGLLGLTKSLALELGPAGIRVNAVAPGWVETRHLQTVTQATRNQLIENNPLGRLAEPEEIGYVCAFLSAPQSDYINGHELRVDGGQVPITHWKHETDRYE